MPLRYATQKAIFLESSEQVQFHSIIDLRIGIHKEAA